MEAGQLFYLGGAQLTKTIHPQHRPAILLHLLFQGLQLAVAEGVAAEHHQHFGVHLAVQKIVQKIVAEIQPAFINGAPAFPDQIDIHRAVSAVQGHARLIHDEGHIHRRVICHLIIFHIQVAELRHFVPKGLVVEPALGTDVRPPGAGAEHHHFGHFLLSAPNQLIQVLEGAEAGFFVLGKIGAVIAFVKPHLPGLGHGGDNRHIGGDAAGGFPLTVPHRTGENIHILALQHPGQIVVAGNRAEQLAMVAVKGGEQAFAAGFQLHGPGQLFDPVAG